MDSLPVRYSGQKSAWMTAVLFLDWFHEAFVPYVCQELIKLGLEPRAVLTLDNCSAHPHSDLLVSTCGKITAIYLPPNVTSLIQPMDQGVMEALKLRYKKKLLRKLLIEDDRGISVVEFLKGVDMKKVSYLVAEAWDEIDPSTLRKSWRKILPLSGITQKEILSITASHSHQSTVVSRILGPLFEEANLNDDFFTLKSVAVPETKTYSYGYSQGIRFRPKFVPTLSTITSEEQSSEQEFQGVLKQIRYQLSETEIRTWLDSDLNDPGIQMLTDSQICDSVLDDPHTDSEDEDEDEQPVISHSEAAFMFEQCLTWLEHQPEVNTYNTTCVRQLQTLAAEKRLSTIKQSEITTFFGPCT